MTVEEGGLVHAMAFGPEGDVLASAGTSGVKHNVRWPSTGASSLRTLQGRSSGIFGTAFSADGQYLLTADEGGLVRLWNVSTDWWVTRLYAVVGRDLSPAERNHVAGHPVPHGLWLNPVSVLDVTCTGCTAGRRTCGSASG